MKQISFFLIGVIFLGLYLFIYNSNPSSRDKEITDTLFTYASQPSWKIKNKRDSFEINSLKATQKNNKEVFLLIEPIFKSYAEDKSKTSVSSKNAQLDVGGGKLTMRNNVHLTFSEKNQKIDLFTEKINYDLSKKRVTSKNKVELKTSSFRLVGKGFDLDQNKKAGNELTFSNAFFVQNTNVKNIFFGKADLIIYQSPSEILTMIGSAEIKLESSIISAEEIIFNFKTNSIVSSKKSKITKS